MEFRPHKWSKWTWRLVIAVVIVFAFALLVWARGRGTDEAVKKPVPAPAVQPKLTPVPPLPVVHKMLAWDVPLGKEKKQRLAIDSTGSDTIPAFDGADIVWTVADPAYEYEVFTPAGTYKCKGESCPAIPPAPTKLSFRSSASGQIEFWYEPKHR